MPLAAYRSGAPGLADMLNWAALVADGVVMCKSGALLAGFYYRAPDLASTSPAERNRVTAAVGQALAGLERGWTVWADAVRLPAAAYPPPEASFFDDEIAQAIDEERRERFEARGGHFVSEYCLVAMHTPPPRAAPLARRLLGGAGAEADFPAEALKSFEAVLGELEDRLSAAVELRRMGGRDRGGRWTDELVDYLNFCLTGQAQQIVLPPDGMYLDAVLGGVSFAPGHTPALSAGDGHVYHAAVAVEGFPSASSPNMLDGLDRLAMPCRWSTRMIMLDRAEAVGELARYRRRWRQKSRGFWAQVFQTRGGPLNQDALLMAGQAEAAMDEARGETARFGYYSAAVLLACADREELLARARRVRKTMQRLGFAARIETLNAVEAWLGFLPGHPHANIRRPLIHTLTLSDLLPLSSVWPGRASCPCPLYPEGSPPLLHAAAEGSTPFRLNLHVGDVGHTLIFGPTGAGKSVLLNILAAQFLRYRGRGGEPASVFAIDRGRSMETVARACGGTHYALSGEDGDVELAPLDALDTEADMAWAAGWLADCFRLQTGRAPEAGGRRRIAAALEQLRAAGPGRRSLSEFCAAVQDAAVREAVGAYAQGRRAGARLDGRRDRLAVGRWCVVETEELLELGPEQCLPVLAHLFRRFEKSLAGQPALLCLGEAWSLLDHDAFRARIRRWLKTLRKANCAVVMETQSLADAAAGGLYPVLLESCPTRILLPNAEADKGGTPGAPGPRDHYLAMGLAETDIAALASAAPRRQYLYVSPEGRRLFDLALGPAALAFAGASGPDARREAEACRRRHGRHWPRRWLERETGRAGGRRA